MNGECFAALVAAAVRARMEGRRLVPREFGIFYDPGERRYRYMRTRSCCPVGALLAQHDGPLDGATGSPIHDAAALLKVSPAEVESFCSGYDGSPCDVESVWVSVAFDRATLIPMDDQMVQRRQAAWEAGRRSAEAFLCRPAPRSAGATCEGKEQRTG
jgi:hypothetical protein